MLFNDPSIEKEYNRLLEKHSDIMGVGHPLINLSDTLRAYFCLADYFTDSSSKNVETMLVGIRSIDLLYSALTRQTVSFDGKVKYKNPIDICSTLFFGMTKNHSFSDGNKRTALLILLYQLDLYGYLPNASVKEFEQLVVAVAANTLDEKYRKIWKKYDSQDDVEVKTIAHFLRKNTKRKDHSYHLKITVRDMTNALEHYGVMTQCENGKIRYERTIPAGLFKRHEQLHYSMPFGGWTRCVGAQTARTILQTLKLYDQFSNYQSFIDGNELFYSLIEDFEGPLRRLKDK